MNTLKVTGLHWKRWGIIPHPRSVTYTKDFNPRSHDRAQTNTVHVKPMRQYTDIKAILRDVMGEEKFYFSLFFIIHLYNDPCCHRIISPQCIRAGHFA